MRVLVVTPYAPSRDGVSAYALHTVAALRRQGDDVEVLSPGPSAAHHHLDLGRPRGALALARRVPAYDRVLIQYHPDVFYRMPRTPASLLAGHLSLQAAFRAAKTIEVVVHEVDHRWGRGATPQAAAARMLWRVPDRIYVHTEAERRAFVDAFRVRPERVMLREHGSDFVRRTWMSRERARASLRIAPDEFTFLSVGFIQPHKGFDRALRAFRSLGLQGCRFDVVGSVRVEEPAYLAHLNDLEALAEDTPGARIHAGYVSDEMFDRWLLASDVIVLPYRHIWSSGVLERAALYGRPVIATRVGGLADQAAAHPGTTVVDGDDELAAAMLAAAGERARAPVVEVPWQLPTGGSDRALRAAPQDAVVSRAAARRRAETRHRGDRTGGERGGPASAVLSAPLRRVPPVVLAPPTSSRLLARWLKVAVRRLTGWQVEPLAAQANLLRDASIRALDGVGELVEVAGGNTGATAGEGGADERGERVAGDERGWAQPSRAAR